MVKLDATARRSVEKAAASDQATSGTFRAAPVFTSQTCTLWSRKAKTVVPSEEKRMRWFSFPPIGKGRLAIRQDPQWYPVLQIKQEQGFGCPWASQRPSWENATDVMVPLPSAFSPRTSGSAATLTGTLMESNQRMTA